MRPDHTEREAEQMVDLEREKPISMKMAAHIYSVALSTVHRWRSRGIGGITLETARLGGKRVTTREALSRFHRRVTEAVDGSTTKNGRRTPLRG